VFVAMSRFRVANGATEAVKSAFRQRPHAVDESDGFLRMEVLSPQEDPDQIWLITHWRDRESFDAWHRSHAFREAHRGIPGGLRLERGATSLQFFELVCE